jgi:hypothetical protein
VTDITYIRSHEGWLYLAVVLDLSRRRSSAGRCSRAWVGSDNGSEFASRVVDLLEYQPQSEWHELSDRTRGGRH